MDVPFHEGAVKLPARDGVWTEEDDAWNDKRTARMDALVAAWADFKDENGDLGDEEYAEKWMQHRAEVTAALNYPTAEPPAPGRDPCRGPNASIGKDEPMATETKPALHGAPRRTVSAPGAAPRFAGCGAGHGAWVGGRVPGDQPPVPAGPRGFQPLGNAYLYYLIGIFLAVAFLTSRLPRGCAAG